MHNKVLLSLSFFCTALCIFPSVTFAQLSSTNYQMNVLGTGNLKGVGTSTNFIADAVVATPLETTLSDPTTDAEEGSTGGSGGRNQSGTDVDQDDTSLNTESPDTVDIADMDHPADFVPDTVIGTETTQTPELMEFYDPDTTLTEETSLATSTDTTHSFLNYSLVWVLILSILFLGFMYCRSRFLRKN